MNLVLSLAMLLSLVAPIFPTGDTSTNVYAADSSSSSSNGFSKQDTDAVTALSNGNLYVLKIDTGVSSGENILFIGVRYKDTDGITRTDYIFPNEGSLKASKEMAAKFGTPYKTKLDLMKNNVAQVDSSLFADDVKGLQVNASEEYLFIPNYTLKSLEGFDIMMKNDINGNNNSWNCRNMQMFKATAVNGYDFYGYYSSELYLDFSGILIGELSDGSYTFSSAQGTDRLYRIRRDTKSSIETERGLKTYDDESSAPTYDSSASKLMLKMDFADVAGAGIEGLCQDWQTKATVSSWNNVFEALSLNIIYTTTTGTKREVNIPATLSTICYLKNNSATKDATIFGLAQMGDTLAIPLNLPGIDTSKKPEITLSYGTTAATTKCKLAKNGTLATGDTINLTGIQLYPTLGSISISDSVMNVTTASTPIYYYTATSTNGFSVSSSTMHKFTDELVKYDTTKNPSLKPADNNTRYLVTITTDTPANAGTISKLYLDVTYTNLSGSDRKLTGINIEEAVNQFYGEWPSNPSGGAYAIKAAAGQTMQFFISANDVKEFTKVKLYIQSGTDDWQFTSITIDGIASGSDAISSRHISWSDTAITSGGYSSHWNITRDVKTTYELTGNHYVNYNDTALVQAKTDGNQEIDVTNYSEPVSQHTDVDWSNYTYSMSYNDTLQDMGYTNARVTYTVTVQVAKDDEDSSDDGDSGSQNMFYFQLLFEDGKTSGYVLANQQLSSDGFVSGKPASFDIIVNYDYGDVTGIRIIPDDTISDEDSFDKLKIEYVLVEKGSNKTLNQTWTINIDDWISIDYRDTGALSSSSGLSGRSESSLARTFNTSTTGYSVNFLVQIQTDGYDYTRGDRFDGVLFAQFTYYDSTGNPQTKTVDVFKSMFEFAGKTQDSLYSYMEFPKDENGNTIVPSLRNETTGEGNNNLVKGCRIDQTFMLNEGTSTYFEVSLSDPNEITGVEFFAASNTVTYWKIGAVNIYTIEGGDGELYIDKNNSYYRNYTTKLLTNSKSETGYTFWIPSNATQNQPIGFTDNKIEVDASALSLKSTVTKEPKSKNDTLNVYVHMKQPLGENEEPDGEYAPTALSEYSMRLGLAYKYTDSHGNTLQDNLEVSQMNKDETDWIFYYEGINASGLASIDGMTLYARENGKPGNYISSNYHCYVDYIVVEQVRSNVVINTYYCDCKNQDCNIQTGGGDQGLDVNLTSQKPTKIDTGTQLQKLTVSLGNNSEEFKCYYDDTATDSKDIVFAINYKTTTGTGLTTYYSRNVFLSDFYEGETIKPGQLVDVYFDVDNVGEITGLQMIAQGVNATFDGACIGTYSNASKETVANADGSSYETKYTVSGSADKWYSINTDREELTLTVKPQLFKTVTEHNIVPVTLTLTTPVAENGEKTGCNDQISLTMAYEDMTGNVTTTTLDNIRDRLVSGSFEANDTAVVRFLASDFSTAHYFEFEPKDSNDSRISTWKLGTLSYEIAGVEGTAANDTVSVNEMIYEGTSKKVNVASIVMQAAVSKVTHPNGVMNTNGETVSLLVDSGEAIRITTLTAGKFAVGSFLDVNVKAYEVASSGATSDVTDDCIALGQSGGVISSVTFTAPANDTGNDVNYKIVITSNEIPSIQLEVDVTVKSTTTSTDKLSNLLTNFVTGGDSQQTQTADSGTTQTQTADSTTTTTPTQTADSTTTAAITPTETADSAATTTTPSATDTGSSTDGSAAAG